MNTWCEAMPLFLGVHFGIPKLKISMKISILGCYCNFLKQLTNLRLFDASPPFFFKLKAYRNQQQGFFFFLILQISQAVTFFPSNWVSIAWPRKHSSRQCKLIVGPSRA